MSFLDRLRKKLAGSVRHHASVLIGLGCSEAASNYSRLGLGLSGVFLAFSAAWILYFATGFSALLSAPLIAFSIVNISLSTRKELRLSRINLLCLIGHLSALSAFYMFSSRLVTVVYSTDGIVGTYMGIVKTLQGQNPYFFSIKPFLEQFGLPPSYYTPKVDGSFEFHLNYPALNFLSLIPLYVAGVRDVRDEVFIFHLLSILLIFHVMPPRAKAPALAVFSLGFPSAIVTSWTDNIWAFFLLLSAVCWYRDKRISLVSLGLSGATKQIALVAAPFLLVRLWHESEQPRLYNLAKGTGLILAGFFIPNLPFLIISPDAWWTGIIGPYLPGSTPMVAAGVGMSEILTDMGITLSPYSFTIMTGVVALVSLVSYSTRFSRLRHYIWLMPIIVLFFYHRCLPNYLFYWLFPLIPELGRFKPVSSAVSGLPRVDARWWMLSLRAPLKGLRPKMAPSAMVLMTLTTVFVGASGAYISSVSTPSLVVRVDMLGDPDDLGVTTQLVVTLTNLGETQALPQFFVKWSPLPVLWTSNSTGLLSPNTDARYLLTATDALGAIPQGVQFRILVYDSNTGQLAGESQTTTAKSPVPRLANPHFRWWALDQSTGRKSPYGWKLTLSNADPLTSGITGLDANFTGGLQLRLNNTSPSVVNRRVSLSQRVSFNYTNFEMPVFQSFRTVLSTSTFFGGKLTDGTHTIYFIFSDTQSVDSVATYPENTTVTIPVPQAAWRTVTFHTQTLWEAQGWDAPLSIEFSVLLQSKAIGVFQASISDIRQIPE